MSPLIFDATKCTKCRAPLLLHVIHRNWSEQEVQIPTDHLGGGGQLLRAQTHTYNDTHTEEKRGLIVVHERNIDGMREKKLGEKMNQKLWVIVPAQCTQLSIVQVLRASAITAQLMPVA